MQTGLNWKVRHVTRVSVLVYTIRVLSRTCQFGRDTYKRIESWTQVRFFLSFLLASNFTFNSNFYFNDIWKSCFVFL